MVDINCVSAKLPIECPNPRACCCSGVHDCFYLYHLMGDRDRERERERESAAWGEIERVREWCLRQRERARERAREKETAA